MPEIDEPLVQLAATHASVRHASQFRKYPQDPLHREPYFEHCRRVALMVRAARLSTSAICAAYLHDTIEDTGATRTDISLTFGETIASYVNLLSDDKEPALSRRVRKTLARIRISSSPLEVQLIKCADILDNGPSIFDNDPSFAAVWFPEALAMLRVLLRGNRQKDKFGGLWYMAHEMVLDGYLALGGPRGAKKS